VILLDTCVIIDWAKVRIDDQETYVASILSRAQLEFGVQLAPDTAERARRRQRLADWDQTMDWEPFTVDASRSYGVVAAATASGGAAGKARASDMLLAAQAHALGATLWTFNRSDFAHVESLIPVATPPLASAGSADG
jgi:predicted nucleic acid-binding protein